MQVNSQNSYRNAPSARGCRMPDCLHHKRPGSRTIGRIPDVSRQFPHVTYPGKLNWSELLFSPNTACANQRRNSCESRSHLRLGHYAVPLTARLPRTRADSSTLPD
ncbi:hypothetical protein F2P81_019505 [Scophthalmus maximus]|uniref:Uncharacterized protein n=1 Tax=Scophthalmus maximus TaxID=52904 RepID=A0A6A4S872_SCOMX|nr:hypothetical protein F2P81_019505 [Scophthalmus maximus]